MLRNWWRSVASAVVAGACVTAMFPAMVGAQSPSVRSQATVDLTFDEVSGPALDGAAHGAAQDHATLVNGAARVSSPFWNQAGKRAVVLDGAARQSIRIGDSPDLDRTEALTLNLLYANLAPPAQQGAVGLFSKRIDQPQVIANYALNYAPASDYLQFYLNDGPGYKIAQFGINDTIGFRKPVFLSVVLQAGDAPKPDDDDEKDDLLFRLYINGKQVRPRNIVGGQQVELDGWFVDVKRNQLLNDAPLLLGATLPGAEFASCLVDEFTLFDQALSSDEIARLFAEVAGADPRLNVDEQATTVTLGPELMAVMPTGLQRGARTVVTLTGRSLLPEPRLLTPVPFEGITLLPGATAERVQFEVQVPGTQSSGHFPLRVRTAAGISAAQVVAIDGLPHRAFAEGTAEQPLTLPIAITGELAGPQTARVYFHGTKGQRLVADLESRRLGTSLDPVLELRSPRGAPLSIVWGQPRLGGDSRIEQVLTADGIYSVEVHDLAYKAPAGSRFRLKLGDLRLVDATFPPAVSTGAQKWVSALGSGIAAEATFPVDMQDAFPGISRPVTLAPEAGVTGPAPAVIASESAEILESRAGEGMPQEIEALFTSMAHVPLVINGRISRSGEVDKYLLSVRSGSSLSFSAASHALRSPLDPQIRVFSYPAAALLSASEERPMVDVAVPADVSQLLVTVADLNGKGGPGHVYRLRTALAGQPDFSLALATGRVEIPAGGSGILRLDVNRTAYDGPIALSLLGTTGVTLSPREIPAGISKAFVVLTADPSTAGSGMVQSARLIGQTTGLTPPLRRAALAAEESRLAHLVGQRGEFLIVVGGQAGARLEVAAPSSPLLRGLEATLPVVLQRENATLADKVVRLSLMTTEAPRQIVDPADPARQRRIPAPLVRSVAEQTLAAGSKTGELQIQVPWDVGEPALDCIVRVDFLPHAFSEKVLATVYSAPFRLSSVPALTLQPGSQELLLTGGKSATYSGKIRRAPGFHEAVELAFLNFPGGFSAPKVIIPADRDEFEITVSAPALGAMMNVPGIFLRTTRTNGDLLLGDLAVKTRAEPGN